ncbi:DUF4225 domain-containing protein [Pseudomonas xanthosomatis]|uniref:DUF4225 domain-containing protein n=1 Tax=Pseudomonas xanthosomatis TaxID=2842356 RepID=UPI001C3C4972|nr:DUF4225 domain-containing protein [Pseudomonas xanthosomatis]QXH45027.1 DUF4225 domain-containing protein [Pseudomonas xanthosomatis]
MKAYGDRLDEAYWEVNAAAARLISYGCGLSARHLKDRRLRMQFNRELAYYARRVLDDVSERKLSAGDALIELRNERDRLYAQSKRILYQSFGVIGGVGQMVTGAGICYGSLGWACGLAGAPLMAHGGNNIYENVRGLYEGRSDVSGPVKKVYQGAAKAVGYTEREGTAAYLASDITMSVGALFRNVPKVGAWKLFKYNKMDKEIAVRQMSNFSLYVEMGVNWASAQQLVETLDDESR